MLPGALPSGAYPHSHLLRSLFGCFSGDLGRLLFGREYILSHHNKQHDPCPQHSQPKIRNTLKISHIFDAISVLARMTARHVLPHKDGAALFH
ncbi:protein of unknown function (plasmid) [Cupriavidus taiwanensis]|uniref:Uncharacterized protein n=1 Tax=Cupriavidus taiwanensis TaxID=164546 RepID=A0A7Z7JDR1_9BURK|nr:protein of unknown function [Cupriavidus taiwanensis]SOZ12585.1 protein of unknown function [Cupriavidus taiwanensis]SOZ43942.1 protein of unknown function [Cupriavidus taiwanensis]SPC23132.1 protein of unknown function [Cupriavidus taiwanensis]SPD54645.1 protein of unknown function [Cupriavidus taiwanensis]